MELQILTSHMVHNKTYGESRFWVNRSQLNPHSSAAMGRKANITKPTHTLLLNATRTRSGKHGNTKLWMNDR